MHSDYTFEARWGSVILDGGITAIPTLILKHQGDLSLTNGEFALVIQAISYKWSGEDPFVSARELAERMGTTRATIRQLTHGLKKKGYLQRYCVDPQQNRWVWDFSGLLRKALELEGITPDPGDGVPEPVPEAESESETEDVPEAVPEAVLVGETEGVSPDSGGVLARTNGGGVSPDSHHEVEQGSETEHKTTTPAVEATSSDTAGTSSDEDSRSEVVVVESEPKSTPNTELNTSSSDAETSEDPQEILEDPVIKETIGELVEVGVSRCFAEKAVKHYGLARCTEVLSALQALDQPPKNPAGWIHKALVEEWTVTGPDPPAPEQSPNQARLDEEKRRLAELAGECREERKELADASPHREFWEEIKEALSGRICRQSMSTWFQPCYILDVTEDRIILSAASAFAAEWIVENYERLLREIAGCEVEVVAGEEKRAA